MYFIRLNSPQNQLFDTIIYVDEPLIGRPPFSIYCDHAKTSLIDCSSILKNKIVLNYLLGSVSQHCDGDQSVFIACISKCKSLGKMFLLCYRQKEEAVLLAECK